MEQAPGDLIITPRSHVLGFARRGAIIGRTASEQEALALACSERPHGRVWLMERTASLVSVDCPVASPLEQLRRPIDSILALHPRQVRSQLADQLTRTYRRDPRPPAVRAISSERRA